MHLGKIFLLNIFLLNISVFASTSDDLVIDSKITKKRQIVIDFHTKRTTLNIYKTRKFASFAGLLYKTSVMMLPFLLGDKSNLVEGFGTSIYRPLRVSQLSLSKSTFYRGFHCSSRPYTTLETKRVIPTRLLYLEDTYRFNGNGNLLEITTGPKGQCLIFDETIFYPKGGGQPSDLGTITFEDGVAYPVSFVGFDGETGKVLHYVTGEIDEARIGTSAVFSVDSERRVTNAKAHTAGHLLDAIVGEIAPELIGKIGSHDAAEGCYVKFQGLLSSVSSTDLIEEVNRRIAAILLDHRSVNKNLVDPSELSGLRLPDGYTLPAGKPCRIVQIEGLSPSPCGGTHVNSLSEFREIQATKVSLVKKEGATKISYKFE